MFSQTSLESMVVGIVNSRESRITWNEDGPAGMSAGGGCLSWLRCEDPPTVSSAMWYPGLYK